MALMNSTTAGLKIASRVKDEVSWCRVVWERLAQLSRDRGRPHGLRPPTPPGIRVRTKAVRPVKRVGQTDERVQASRSRHWGTLDVTAVLCSLTSNRVSGRRSAKRVPPRCLVP